MSKVAILYLSKDANLSKQAEFLRVAQRLGKKYGVTPHPIESGVGIISAIGSYADSSISHLITLCHGFPDRLFRHDAGVSCLKEHKPEIISIQTFAEVIAPKLVNGAKISLCSCLCGRDPRWYLIKRYGAAVDQWSPYANRDGGEKSLAGILRDLLLGYRNGAGAKPLSNVYIRAHTVAGHITYAAPIRDFCAPLGSAGKSLFGLVLPDVPVDWGSCKWWNTNVRGELAEDLVLFSNDLLSFSEIRHRWQDRK